MPSPVGHILAGAAIGLACAPAGAVAPRLSRSTWRWVALPALLAALPDADLLIPHFHRRGSHSLIAVALVLIVTMVVTGRVTLRKEEGRREKGEEERAKGKGKSENGKGKSENAERWRWAFALTAAYASHLILDLLGADPNPPSGIQLLWPFSDRWFISGIDWFPGTERRLGHPDLIATNVRALFWELLTLGPVLIVSWLATRTRRSRVPTSVRDSLPPPSA